MLIYRGDTLHIQEWEFHAEPSIDHVNIVLIAYSEKTRPTTRHKFKNIQIWNKKYTRNNTLNYWEVPTPEDVLQEVRGRVFEIVNVNWN